MAKATEKAIGTYGASNTLVSPERAEELRKRLKAKLSGQLSAGIDPEILAIGTELTVFHMEAGARKFVDVAKRVGRIPTEVHSDSLSLKFRARNPPKAIRAKCLDCRCGNAMDPLEQTVDAEESAMTPEKMIKDLSSEAKEKAEDMLLDKMGRMIRRIHELPLVLGDDEEIKKLIREAEEKGDLEADGILCGVAGNYLSRCEHMPPALKDYIVQKLFRDFGFPGRRNRGKQTNWTRNYFIVSALERLRRAGIPPTQNEATRHKETDSKSGCEIVADLLNEAGINIQERGVEKVWNVHRRTILRGAPPDPA